MKLFMERMDTTKEIQSFMFQGKLLVELKKFIKKAKILLLCSYAS